jgi:hypothetical protein
MTYFLFFYYLSLWFYCKNVPDDFYRKLMKMNVYGEIQLNELTSALSMADYVTILFCLLEILGIS